MARPVLLYDGGCGYCRRWVDWCLAHGARVSFEPCGSWHGRRTLGITDGDCRRSAWYVDDREVRSGAAAINAVLATMPTRRHRLLARVGRLPLVRGAEEVAYRWVARNRHRLRGPRTKPKGEPRAGPRDRGRS